MPTPRAALLEPVTVVWECPNCNTRALKRVSIAPGEGVTEMHACPARGGFSMPMIPAGSKRRVVVHEREDYIGDQHVQRDGDGRPVMAVHVERDDGFDSFVYAPVAVHRVEPGTEIAEIAHEAAARLAEERRRTQR